MPRSDRIILALSITFGFFVYLVGAFGKFDGTYAAMVVLFALSCLWLRYETRRGRVTIKGLDAIELLTDPSQKPPSAVDQKVASQAETFKLTCGVEFKNPWGGVNYKTYVGRADMPDGRISTLYLEAKYRDTDYSDAFDPKASPEAAATAGDKLVVELALISENIRQARAGLSPDMAVLWIVGDETGTSGDPFLIYVRGFIEKAIRDGSHSTIGGVTNPRWFSEYFYFGKCRGYQPGTTMELPKNVWRYSYQTGRFEDVTVASILMPKTPVEWSRRMTMNQRSAYYLDALARNSEILGGLSFRNALAQSNLDYSVESLNRVDYLLDQIRTRYRPQYGDFLQLQANQNFLFLLCFYVGTVVSKNAKQEIKWLDYEEMLRALPENAAVFPQCFQTTITCILSRGGLFVPLSSICSRLFDDPTDKSVPLSAHMVM